MIVLRDRDRSVEICHQNGLPCYSGFMGYQGPIKPLYISFTKFIVRTEAISENSTLQLLSFLGRDTPRPYISLFRIRKANTRNLIGPRERGGKKPNYQLFADANKLFANR